jgi:hypothetical protein
MKRKLTTSSSALMWAMMLLVFYSLAADAQTRSTKKVSGPQAATTAAVGGGGTAGQIPKWMGSNSTSYILGDSAIFEDKFAKVGIGTTAPTSKLTVQGMIETTLGGYKFPDGTIQTTAALSGLQSVIHNSTLTGDGTSASKLGVAVPLALTGTSNDPIISALNNGDGPGIFARGSNQATAGGTAVIAYGGKGGDNFGGYGVFAIGGDSDSDQGGTALSSTGGRSNLGNGGSGAYLEGGQGSGASFGGGPGILAVGGKGINGAVDGLAGGFIGNVQIYGNLSTTGTLSKGGGSFKIDHPLDPENKYLYHSFVESPDMKNIYDGVAVLDANGEAVVQLPDWFEALNRDFRYLLTAIGAPAPTLYIATKVNKNHFKIAGGQPGMEVSWQVTGIRQDNWANKHRIPVEEQKPEIERGYYLHPEAINRPEEKQVEWARHPEWMKQLKKQKPQ